MILGDIGIFTVKNAFAIGDLSSNIINVFLIVKKMKYLHQEEVVIVNLDSLDMMELIVKVAQLTHIGTLAVMDVYATGA